MGRDSGYGTAGVIFSNRVGIGVENSVYRLDVAYQDAYADWRYMRFSRNIDA